MALALIGNRPMERAVTQSEGPAEWTLSTRAWTAGAEVDVQSTSLVGGGASLWIGNRHLRGMRQLEHDRMVFRVPADLQPGTHELRVLLPSGRLLEGKEVDVRGGAGLQVRPVAAPLAQPADPS